jgi:hypothetical protein
MHLISTYPLSNQSNLRFLAMQILYLNISSFTSLKRQCQPQCICLHFTLKVMECQQITIINISLVLCRYNSVKMSKYNHRMVEIYDGLKTKTWITLPMLLFEHCLSAQCIVVDIVPLSPPHTRATCWANRLARQLAQLCIFTAHVGKTTQQQHNWQNHLHFVPSHMKKLWFVIG